MKKTIILSLCTLAAFACAKEVAPVAESNNGVKVVPATIEASIDASKLGFDSSFNLFWGEGDQVRSRTTPKPNGTDVDPTIYAGGKYDLFTAVNEGGNVKFTGNFTYIPNMKMFLYAAMNGLYSDDTSSSNFKYDWPQDQRGTLEDIRDYTILWSNIAPDAIQDKGDGTYGIKASFTPFFCLLKFNVAEGLGVTKIKVSGSSLGGRLVIVISRTPNTFGGSNPFANFVSTTEYPVFNDINITRDGDEIYGDVYVSVCPNDYSAEAGDFINNSSNLTLTFYDETDAVLGEFNRTLTTPMKNACIKNLGNVTNFEKKEPTEFKPILTAVRSDDTKDFTPKFIGFTEDTFIEKGAKFYYEVGSSLDAVATPTVSSNEIPETGIPVDVATAYDCKYFKVLATCPGFNDVYIKGVIRDWLFGKGYTLATSNGLEVPFEPGNPDAAYLSTPAFKANSTTYMTAKTILGGNVSLFLKAHAGSNDKTFTLEVGDNTVVSLPCSGGTYSSSNPACLMSSPIPADVNVDCKVGMKTPTSTARNFYVWYYAVIEQQEFSPAAASQAKAGIDALTNGTQYNF